MLEDLGAGENVTLRVRSFLPEGGLEVVFFFAFFVSVFLEGGFVSVECLNGDSLSTERGVLFGTLVMD